MSTVNLFDRESEARKHGRFRLPAQFPAQSGLPFLGAEPLSEGAANRPSRQVQLVVKRVADIVITLLALAFLAPLLATVAILVKLSGPGPILFRQPREGLGGGFFEIYKFRTMHVDACDVSGVTQTLSNDARVTRIGRFIRRTSIDELPQLFNVLRGEMSLVGPRPHVANMRAGGMAYTELVPYYHLRLQMRPGLTGWAQSNGYRGPTVDATKARRRIDHDIAYIQNFSLWLDARIIGRTLVREFLVGSGE